jgi:hypothetical protein
MNCDQFPEAWVGDDPVELRDAEYHAAGCPKCAELMKADHALAEQVEAWKSSAAGPPLDLQARIAKALRDAAPYQSASFRPRTLPRVASLAAAAALIMAAVVFLLPRETQPPTDAESLVEALNRIDRSADDYAGAIAELELRAEAVLARASDPDVRPADAALLLNYRDRLSNLDSVILEVRSYLDEHPGNAGGHMVLLAAYEEKKEVLGELLALRIGETS